jgi:hypothetical protein
MTSLADKFASRLAQLAPFGKRSDDPLTSLKGAARWIEELPIGDAFKCQEAILQALKRFNENPTQYTKDRLAIFMLLDEKSRDLQDTLVRQYLRNPRMSHQTESQLWRAVYGLFWEIARGYHAFVSHLGREAGNVRLEDWTPLVTLRAIRVFGQLLKWYAIRYLPADERLWLRLHNLYRIAESQGFQRQPRRAYVEDTSEYSCETAYLHILMLDLSNSGTLYPKQLDLVDRWLCGWHEMLRLEDRPASANSFAVDLSADHGPRRVRKPDADKPVRYWDTTALLQKLQELHAALREGRAPALLGLTEDARSAESLELLEHLQRQWASLTEREQRRSPRAAIKRLVDVAHGLGTIARQIKAVDDPARGAPYGSGLSYNEADDVQVYGFITDRTRERVAHAKVQPPASQPSPDVERWVIHDESEYGYGAVVESGDNDWLRVGALISVRLHDATEWQLGVVRRLSRLGGDTRSVGIEILAKTPVPAILHDVANSGYTVDGFDNSGSPLPHTCLWLGGDPVSIILDPIHFAPGRVFQVHGIPEQTFVAVVGNPIERSEGWMRVIVEPVNG